jgi:hypothetical protein
MDKENSSMKTAVSSMGCLKKILNKVRVYTTGQMARKWKEIG